MRRKLLILLISLLTLFLFVGGTNSKNYAGNKEDVNLEHKEVKIVKSLNEDLSFQIPRGSIEEPSTWNDRAYSLKGNVFFTLNTAEANRNGLTEYAKDLINKFEKDSKTIIENVKYEKVRELDGLYVLTEIDGRDCSFYIFELNDTIYIFTTVSLNKDAKISKEYIDTILKSVKIKAG